jgi:hypothetical protein
MYEGEKKLWHGVILQAIEDALNRKLRRTRKEAVGWILNEDPDFKFACDCAGVDSDAIRRGFLALKKQKNFR